MAELTGRDLSPVEVAAAVRASFGRRTGLRLQAADWTADELQRIEALSAEKYARTAWNAKR